MSFHVPENKRAIFHESHPLYSNASYGGNGVFKIGKFNCIVSDGIGGPKGLEPWEHVSVSIDKGKRCPTWEEMCRIKEIFWDAEDCVLQYHPPESEYVNCHPYTLHLWRPIGVEVPRPDSIMVGPK